MQMIFCNKRAAYDSSTIRFKGGLKFGMPAGNKGKWVLEGAYVYNIDQYSNTPEFKATDELDEIKFDGFKGGISYYNNTLNRKQYPSDGRNYQITLNLY